MRTIWERVSLKELKTNIGGIVEKKKILSTMKARKNVNIHEEFLIATSWLSGYASYVERTYIMKMLLPSSR